MKDLSVIILLDAAGGRLLLRRRGREPYKGLYDFVGCSRGGGEDALGCAYRALHEHTGFTREDIDLRHIMDFAYQATQWCVQVFSGHVARTLTLDGERPLAWVDRGEDFFADETYAGEGYIGHILAHMEMQEQTPEELSSP